MEMLIVISLMIIILLGGSTIFIRNLRSSGVGNVDLSLNSEVRAVLSLIERDIRYSLVDSVGVGLRSECLAAGVSGYTGNSLTVIDLRGLKSTYYLSNEMIASESAATSEKVNLTNPSSQVTALSFTWYCVSGVSDKIKIDINFKSSVLGSGFDITRTVSREVNLLNSGVN